MAHPLQWHCSIEPSALSTLTVVPRGARSAGSVADALVVNDAVEQARRRRVGLGAVTSLALLDALMNLPTGQPIRIDDLSQHAQHQILRAPSGVVDIDGPWITRLLTPPLTVVAAAVRASTWRRAIERAGRFTPFTQRLMLLDRVPSPKYSWEAQVAGIGVWAVVDGTTLEVCRPEPYMRRYWKPAGWRFTEYAHAAALTSTPQPGSPYGSADHPARTASAVSGLH